MTCDICKRVRKTKNAATLKQSLYDLYGLIEYFTPVWERWHLCRDCLSDLTYMLLAARDAARGVNPAITTKDFSRHAEAIHARMREYERECAGTHTHTHAHTGDGMEVAK